MLKAQSNSYIGFFWAPVEYYQVIQEAISGEIGTKVESYTEHSIPKPTYFKSSEFIAPFQLITDTYGIPSYQEANPTVVSIVTFPFLFGMMFGDLGHGSIIFTFSAFMVMFNKQLKGSILEVLLPYRYMFMLLGLMSSYCGLMYNEFFALPMNLFGSCYNIDKKELWAPALTQ